MVRLPASKPKSKRAKSMARMGMVVAIVVAAIHVLYELQQVVILAIQR